MKKNLLTFLFVMVFVCGGALVVSAKNTSSPANSVAVSKNLLSSKDKAKELYKARVLANSLKNKCGGGGGCGNELAFLIISNDIYSSYCAEGGYQVGCAPVLEGVLLFAAAAYEACISGFTSNIDKEVNRNKRIAQNTDFDKLRKVPRYEV